jgi:ATPase subunit of ABC transporter with duplicated ATPase domains
LCNFRGALIVVSHDKYFLNAITTHIADIDYETVITYPGNYDQMLVAKTSVREKAELENKAREKKVAQLKEFVAKFGAGTRASQVQSRVKEIQKLQPQELKKSNIQRPYIRFSTPETNSGQVVFNVKKLCKSFDDKKVFHNASFEILRGDKIAVIGSNGKGKTTLLKLLSGIYQSDSGQIITGHQVDIGYFPQNHEEMVDKTQEISLFDWLKNVKPGLYDQDVRGVLGKLLFGGDDAFKPVKALSGGETARLLLAKLMLNSPNTIILDEPNNHLDLESVSALAWGLEDYRGTAIVASHDRNLVNNFATKIIALENDGLHFFAGPLEEYLKQKQ